MAPSACTQEGSVRKTAKGVSLIPSAVVAIARIDHFLLCSAAILNKSCIPVLTGKQLIRVRATSSSHILQRMHIDN